LRGVNGSARASAERRAARGSSAGATGHCMCGERSLIPGVSIPMSSVVMRSTAGIEVLRPGGSEQALAFSPLQVGNVALPKHCRRGRYYGGVARIQVLSGARCSELRRRQSMPAPQTSCAFSMVSATQQRPVGETIQVQGRMAAGCAVRRMFTALRLAVLSPHAVG